MVKASREAGSFLGGGLGGFLSSPFGLGSLGVIALLGLGFIFKDKISDFFQKTVSDIGQGLGDINVNLPTINFPEITFPEIKFPDFPNPFEGFNLDSLFPKDDPVIVSPEQMALNTAELGKCQCGTSAINQDAFGIVTVKCTPCAMADPEGTDPAADPEFIRAANELEFRSRQSPIQQIIGSVQSAIPDQQFQGGGLSFIGGSVSEIPLERLSLGSIIDRLGVTASQAASLRAEAIGFTPQEQAFLNQGQEISPLGDLASQPQTSGGFEGLTPEQIALRLTGGIISNF